MHCLGYNEDPLVGGFAEGGIDICYLQFLIFHKTVHALTDHAETFLDGFLESAANSHHFSDRFHAGAKFLVNAMKLGEIPPRNLAHHVVESRLKKSRSSLRDGD